MEIIVVRINKERMCVNVVYSFVSALDVRIRNRYRAVDLIIYRLSVTRYQVSPRDWTPGLRLSVGVIADVHAGGPLMPAERIRAIA